MLKIDLHLKQQSHFHSLFPEYMSRESLGDVVSLRYICHYLTALHHQKSWLNRNVSIWKNIIIFGKKETQTGWLMTDVVKCIKRHLPQGLNLKINIKWAHSRAEVLKEMDPRQMDELIIYFDWHLSMCLTCCHAHKWYHSQIHKQPGHQPFRRRHII